MSGRQIGVDRAALDAAAAVPFPCGGCAWGRRDAGKVVSKVLFLLANLLLIIAPGCGDAARDMYLMGVAEGKNGHLDRAVLYLNLSIVLKPNDAPSYFARGLARNSKGDLARAVSDYTKAIELDSPRGNDAPPPRSRGRSSQCGRCVGIP